jgi:hypothetical protein
MMTSAAAPDTPTVREGTFHTYESIQKWMLQSDKDWDDFLYLPMAESLTFQNVQCRQQGSLKNYLSHRLWVGTYMRAQKSLDVFAIVHRYAQSQRSAMNQVSYVSTVHENLGKLDASQFKDIEWVEPFKSAWGKYHDEAYNREMFRFLILFFFMEKGHLKDFKHFGVGIHNLKRCCMELAKNARAAGKGHVRERQPLPTPASGKATMKTAALNNTATPGGVLCTPPHGSAPAGKTDTTKGQLPEPTASSKKGISMIVPEQLTPRSPACAQSTPKSTVSILDTQNPSLSEPKSSTSDQDKKPVQAKPSSLKRPFEMVEDVKPSPLKRAANDEGV